MVLKLGHFGKRIENILQVLNVVLGKDGDQLDRSCEKLRSITWRQGGREYPAYNKRKEG
jgi:hypothetical protein